MELRLAAALKAKIPADRIINFMPVENLTAWIAGVRSKIKLAAVGTRRLEAEAL